MKNLQAGRGRLNRLRGEVGFSLLELLISVFLLGVVFMGLTSLSMMSLAVVKKAELQQHAQEAGLSVSETMMDKLGANMPYVESRSSEFLPYSSEQVRNVFNPGTHALSIPGTDGLNRYGSAGVVRQYTVTDQPVDGDPTLLSKSVDVQIDFRHPDPIAGR